MEGTGRVARRPGGGLSPCGPTAAQPPCGRWILLRLSGWRRLPIAARQQSSTAGCAVPATPSPSPAKYASARHVVKMLMRRKILQDCSWVDKLLRMLCPCRQPGRTSWFGRRMQICTGFRGRLQRSGTTGGGTSVGAAHASHHCCTTQGRTGATTAEVCLTTCLPQQCIGDRAAGACPPDFAFVVAASSAVMHQCDRAASVNVLVVVVAVVAVVAVVVCRRLQAGQGGAPKLHAR